MPTVRSRLRLDRPERLLPALLFTGVLAGFALLFRNLFHNLDDRNITSGFAYLSHTAGFQISEAWIAYSPQSSFARAFLVGLLNTLAAATVIGIAITIIGALAGIALSFGGPDARVLLKYYVGLTRNVPVLLHLVAWYALLREALPSPRAAFHVAGAVLSNRGLILPFPTGWGSGLAMMEALGAGFVCLALSRSVWRSWRIATALLSVLVALAIWLVQLPMSFPELRGFNHVGGRSLSPEFCALVVALSIYSGGYVVEIVRGAVDNFNAGQVESAFALGLSKLRFFFLVMVPQVVRQIAPAMVSQYVNVVKGTSLGVIVGYPDLVTVSNSTLNQTGQAVEAILLILVSYLTISLTVSWSAQRVLGRRVPSAAL